MSVVEWRSRWVIYAFFKLHLCIEEHEQSAADKRIERNTFQRRE